MKFYILICFIGFTIRTAFDVPKDLFTDYRDNYTGHYFCNSYCQTIKGNETKSINSDTITIAITKDALDSILLITIGKSLFQVKLNKEGLYAYPRNKHFGGKFFSNDSISFSLSLGMSGLCSYMGKKNKK